LVAARTQKRLRQGHRYGRPQLPLDKAGVEIGMKQRLISQPGSSKRIGNRQNRSRPLIIWDGAELYIKQCRHTPGYDVGAVIKETSQLALLESAAHPPDEQVDKL
jgi:hypothetical protein